MKEFDYDYLKKLVFRYLWKSHHERHLEDCIQYCALAYFEGRTNVQWTVIDYCRINGIGDRGKQTARTLEFATSVGLSSDEDENVKENGFLFDKVAVENHTDQDDRDTTQGILEEFLAPLGLKMETMRWVLKSYQSNKEKTKLRFRIQRQGVVI